MGMPSGPASAVICQASRVRSGRYATRTVWQSLSHSRPLRMATDLQPVWPVRDATARSTVPGPARYSGLTATAASKPSPSARSSTAVGSAVRASAARRSTSACSARARATTRCGRSSVARTTGLLSATAPFTAAIRCSGVHELKAALQPTSGSLGEMRQEKPRCTSAASSTAGSTSGAPSYSTAPSPDLVSQWPSERDVGQPASERASLASVSVPSSDTKVPVLSSTSS